MIQFDELKMANDRSSLSIKCSVETAYTSYVYIKKVDIMYYTEASVLSSTSKKKNLYTGTSESKQTYGYSGGESPVYLATLETPLGIDTLKNGMFFVVVTCEVKTGVSIPASLPCGADNLVHIGIILDWKSVYEHGMQYVSALLADCNPCPAYDKYEQFILNWYGLRMAIATCDAVAAAKMWERFLRAETSNGLTVSATGCGCGS